MSSEPTWLVFPYAQARAAVSTMHYGALSGKEKRGEGRSF